MTAFRVLLMVTAVTLPYRVYAQSHGTDDRTQAEDEIVITGVQTGGDAAYTIKGQTTATRLPVTLRETPQSVSVVTRAQIKDFQLNDVNALLTTVPGVTVLPIDTDRVNYSSRGFDIQTFQLDGIGVPFAFGVQTGSIDTAIYDHIEVLKGAPGLLSSTGNPAAVVNFIRKRPTRNLQVATSAQYGSFDSVRLEGDASVPLTHDGGIRARVVGVYSDADSYLDRYHLRRWTGYGVVEADLGPNTVISGGYGYQDHQSSGAMWGEIPLYYTDGTRIPLPRSASTAPKWAGWGVTDRQIFGDITHTFGNGWVARVSAIRKATDEDDALFYVYGNPSRTTGAGIFTYPGAFKAPTRNLTMEAYVTGPVTLFGRQHDLMFGVNRSAQDYKQYSSYDSSAIGVAVTLPSILAGSFPRPNFPASYDLSLNQHTRREAAYGLLRLSVADPLKIMIGGNVTHAKSEGVSYTVPSNFNNTRFLPFAGATLDLTPNISAYASYSTIFNPQTATDVNNRVLAPIKGSNLEGGFKGAWFGNRLNASIAVFKTKQDNTAQSAGFANGRTISVGVDARSEGIEAEIGGMVLPGLQASGGFTTMRLRADANAPARTFVPRDVGRFNLAYTPPSFDALKLGVSFQYQSKVYVEPTGVVSSTTGAQVRVTQGAYALLDLVAAYELTPNLSLSLNVRNVTNTKYLTALTYDQSYYGAPRTVLSTISVRY